MTITTKVPRPKTLLTLPASHKRPHLYQVQVLEGATDKICLEGHGHFIGSLCTPDPLGWAWDNKVNLYLCDESGTPRTIAKFGAERSYVVALASPTTGPVGLDRARIFKGGTTGELCRLWLDGSGNLVTEDPTGNTP